MRSILAQFAIVAVAAALLTFVTIRFNYQSGFNAVWMFGLPLVVGLVANRDAGSRTLMALLLLICSPVASIAAAAATGLPY